VVDTSLLLTSTETITGTGAVSDTMVE